MATPAPNRVAVTPQPAPVFVSHTTKDRAMADRLVASLEAVGIRCWIAPRDIKLGDDWPAAITFAVASCRALVVLVTNAASQSRHVQREVQMADDAERPILPVIIGGAELSPALQYLLASTQQLTSDAGIGEAAGHRIRERLLELSDANAAAPANARKVAEAISKSSDATLWRVYASTRSSLVLWTFYGATMALPLFLQERLELATRVLAFVAGMLVVAVTRRANLPVLFTIGFVQPVFMLMPIALGAPELVLLSVTSAPPLPYGALCAAGGLVMSLRFGLPRLGVLSLNTWRAWLYPTWSVLKRRERLGAVLRILVVAAALALMALSLSPR